MSATTPANPLLVPVVLPWLVCGSALLLALLARPSPVQGQPPPGTPELAIQTVTTSPGAAVQLPVRWSPNGAAIAGMLFSLDFDGGCLAFDASDADGDGLPDAVAIDLPPGFRRSIGYNVQDSDGELDIILIDQSLPLAAMPASAAIVTIHFTTSCPLAGAAPYFAAVIFSDELPASFGDLQARDVAGVTTSGGILIDAAAATPTPTSSATPIGAPTHTPTHAVPQTPATPSGTPRPTLSPTLTPTAVPGATATPTLSPIATETPPPPKPTGDGLSLFLPHLLQQSAAAH
jgi:hypothetical protein